MTDTQFPSRRSPVMGRNGTVATSQPLATAAGLSILAAGGNAADAAVATAAALNVTEPTSTGIGGDMFALYYDAHTKQITALNGSGRAPSALSLERLQKENIKELPPFHPYTITVPGACAGWFDLIEKHGTLPMSQILAPAINLAENGFPVAPITAHFWERGAGRQLASALNGHELTIDGRAPKAGEIFSNKGLARTFRKIAEDGKKAYYEGEIAESIAQVIQQSGGCLTTADLAAHHSTWDEPISVNYRGYRIWECPPNGQGLAALLALNLLEGFDLASLAPLSTRRLHLQIEAMRLAFADARWYVSDPAFSSIPLNELLSKAYSDERRKLINLKKATLDQKHGTPIKSSGTVYFSVVDKDGNACSFIISNYMGFGTGIVPKGWGFTLQNRGHNFNLEADHPNSLQPNKRPYHTIIPAMATREEDGSLYASYGVMGGFMQPQGHMQVACALIDDGMDPQTALDMPRFCIEPTEDGGFASLEEGIPDKTIAALARRGHPTRKISGWERALFGRGQVIVRERSGVLVAGSDSRADGCAMTL
ncbi:gamma-glutamyltransferase [Candidatus Villigracilis saccharophilus]|uniref:gamma-glutamyltransferase n=1 Tax=Candidatus Villigracilis saccharophilus TaxID=3140684 RepID=UPI003134F08F|nr:gamma-glutamyltransferase [Anaerolineales bacterium]